MKNIILVIILMITLISCDINQKKEKPKKTTLTYVVFYPGYRDTVTVFNYEDYQYGWGCSEGENYIMRLPGVRGNIYSGSAPFKILSYTKR